MKQLECGPMHNVMAAQPNIGGALCESSVISFLVCLPRRKVRMTPTGRVPCSNACQYRRTQNLDAKWSLHQTKFRQGAKAPGKCIHSVPVQETAKHRAKFGWLPVNDVAAVTKPRRETRWNLLGCPKLANRSQPFPLVGRPKLPWDMWRRYCCLTSFFDCWYMP